MVVKSCHFLWLGRIPVMNPRSELRVLLYHLDQGHSLMRNAESEISNINVQLLSSYSDATSYSTASACINRSAITSNSLTSLQVPHPHLPPYMRQLPGYMSEDDVDYLWRIGAFSIPEKPLLNELLASYTEFVHPSMPVVDLHGFLRRINHNEGEPISLILFQAIMFTASAFVDVMYLCAAEFMSRKAARKAFYERAKVCNRLSSSEITTI